MEKTLIIDGYNMLYYWEETRYLMESKENLADFARTKLIREVANYIGYLGQKGVIVFDAHLLSDNKSKIIEESSSLIVLYTKKGETADERIEYIISQTPKEQRGNFAIVTGDNLLQKMIFSYGAIRITCNELAYYFKSVAKQENKGKHSIYFRNTLNTIVSDDVLRVLEAIRRKGSK